MHVSYVSSASIDSERRSKTHSRRTDNAFTIRNQDETLRYLLRLTDVESVNIKHGQALGSREMAKQLGVDQKLIRWLVQQGHLRKKPRTVDGYRTSKFDVHTARQLLGSLGVKIRPF